MSPTPRWVGQSLPRQEDAPLLLGQARFIDDLSPVPGIRHAAILRSPHGHAAIERIDVERARALPGVVGVLTGAEIAAAIKPITNMIAPKIRFLPCAVDRVRYFGEPVAVVVADSRYVAEDALDLIDVAYRPLPGVASIDAALDPQSPLLHEEVGSNAVHHRRFSYGDPDAAFAAADRTIALTVDYPRVSSTPIETYGAVAAWDAGAGRYTIWSNFQGPFALHPLMCDALRVRSPQLQLIAAPSSGGSFGIKHGIYPYLVLLAVASRLTGVPVKWIEDRLEHLAAASAASGRRTAIEGAFRADGTLLGLRLQQTENVGAYVRVPEPAGLYRMHATVNGPYRVRDVAIENRVVVTNQVPSGLNRGYGGPQFYFPLERLMDVAAHELGLDPVTLRRRNLVRRDEFPYEGPAGSILDSGDYQAALDLALQRVGYEALAARAAERRRAGRLAGVGVALAVETSGSNMAYVGLALTPEQRARSLPKSGAAAPARLVMDALGGVTVQIDSVPAGQGHRTVIAQIVADELGLRPDDIEVVTDLDTRVTPWSITSGNYSNRFSTTVASSAAIAARRAAATLRRVAARELGVPPEQVELANGGASAPGARNEPIPIRRLAGQLHWHSTELPDGVDGPIDEAVSFAPATMTRADGDDRVRSSLTYSFQVDVAAVEIDPRTGRVEIERYATIHDAGTLLNPMLVEGQILGGFAHGFGAAMTERVAYDADGTLLTATFQDYMCPTAPELPRPVIDHLSTPSPNTLHGAKGLGDGCSMIAPVAIANAIADATGLRDLAPPFTPARVWCLLQGLDPDAPEPAEAPVPEATAATAEPPLALPGKPLTGEGQVALPAPPETVWRLLTEVDRLADVIPGCRALHATGPNRYALDIDIRVAGIGGRYDAALQLADLEAPRRLRLVGRATGKLGDGAGEAHVTLTARPDGGTDLAYRYRAGISGKVAGFGHRMLDGVARVLIGAFFANLGKRMGGPVEAPAAGGWLTRLRRRLFGGGGP